MAVILTFAVRAYERSCPADGDAETRIKLHAYGSSTTTISSMPQ